MTGPPILDPADLPDPAGILDDVEAALRRYVAYPSESALVAVVLWTAHTHALDYASSTPRLVLVSPEPECGKTRTLEVLEWLVPQPLYALSPSVASVFRLLDKEQPCLLFDECDTIFTRHGKNDDHQDLRGLLNAGHRRGATIPRCVGPHHDVRRFPVFAAAALAGIGDLPDTIMSRSVIVRMRRRAPREHVEPFELDDAAEPLGVLRERLAVLASASADRLRELRRPQLPGGVVDRPADVWRPLLAVAEAVGGDWPERGREACAELCRAATGRDASLGVKLLTDLRAIFDGQPALHTDVVLTRLRALEESPWDSLRGYPLDARGLAWRLRQYGVEPRGVRVGDRSARGYRAEDLHDPWSRYLPSPPAEGSQASQPSQTPGSVNLVNPVNPVREPNAATDGDDTLLPEWLGGAI